MAAPRDANLDKYCRDELGTNDLSNVPPKNEASPDQPLFVYVKFKVIDIDEIHEADMDFRLHMYFKTFWNDTRLRRQTSLTSDCSSYAWTPDVMFETAKTVHTFDTVSTSFVVEPEGRVIMTDRYSIRASCAMNFRKYPFDTQKCIFYVAFMTTFDAVALLKWFDDDSSPFSGPAIEFLRPIELLQYHLGEPSTHFMTVSLSYANYTYLVANFTLERRLTGSIVSIYLPSSLVVAVSWVTFWLRPEAAPARVSLSITSLLTLCTQVQQYKSQLPSVNYITAMDVWLFVCIFEVFATLLEFAICYNAYVGDRDRQKLRKARKVKEQEQAKSLSASEETKLHGWTEERREGSVSVRAKLVDALLFRWTVPDGHKMDAFCRKYFPLSFLAFVLVYWTYNLLV